MQEENPRRTACTRAGRELWATPGRARCHDRDASLLRDGDGVIDRSAIADGDVEAEVTVAKGGERAGEGAACVQRRDDDVEIRRYWLQAAPPRTQNFAQCGWLSGTAPTLSARVSPSSNCGS